MPRTVGTSADGAAGEVGSESIFLNALNALETTRNGAALRFWEALEPVVIVGRFGDISREVDEEACATDGVPILRRLSGGGAVVVGRGCLNYSLLLSLDARPELRDVTRSYQLVLDRLVEALGVSGLTLEGMSDIAWNGRKVSGNAQRRGRHALLHHGTLLYDFDARLMERYLKQPSRAPAYRCGRSHASFVANLPLAAGTIRERVSVTFDIERAL